MQTTVKAGAASVNITPSVGQDNMGDYGRLVPAKGVGNELYAKALVLDDGENRVALVTADIISFSSRMVEDIRRRIEKLTGIDGRNVLLSASHTHSSPATAEWDQPSKEYIVELDKKIAGVVYLADQGKRAAFIGSGIGEANVSINRWQKTSTGVRWGPNPNAPVDHQVSVLRVDGLERKPIAILVNFASHPSVMGGDNLLYSGDYVSYVQSTIEKAYGGQITAMFCTGAGGDIKIALLTEDKSQFRYGDLDDCRRFGTIVGAEAIKVVEGITTTPVENVSAKTIRVELPLFEPPSIDEVGKELEMIEKELADLEAAGARTDEKRLQLDWANTTLAALKDGTVLRSIPAEVQLIRIGDEVVLFAVPGELFVDVGMKLKGAMGLPGSFVVAYANGFLGYLPSRQAEEDSWCRHDDTYKSLTGLFFPANFSGGIEDTLIVAVKELLGNTKPVSRSHSSR